MTKSNILIIIIGEIIMKMEIDLTESQAEKVQLLKENGIEVGEAIEMFFDMKDAVSESTNQILDLRIQKANEEKAELEEKLAKVENDISLFDKIKDSTIDSTQKQKIVEKEYGLISKTYDEKVQNEKRKMKWSSFFSF